MQALLTPPVLDAVLAFVAVAALLPLVAMLWGALGRRDGELSLRKVHRGEVPRVGGLVVLMVCAGIFVWRKEQFQLESGRTELLGVVLGAFVCGLIGLADDFRGVRAKTKLVGQFAAGIVAVALGLEWVGLVEVVHRNWFSALVTVSFLVTCVNGFNLIDGIDGLAGGCMVIVMVVVAGSVHVNGNLDSAIGWVATVVMAAAAGFLVHNRNPAKVFLGDGGAYFFGFIAGGLVLFLEPVRPRHESILLSIPMMALALPLLDTALAILRRLVRGQPIFTSDADHMHHRLLGFGLSAGQSVGILWFIAGFMGLMAFLNVAGVDGTWTLLGSVIVLGATMKKLGYHRILEGEGAQNWRARRRQIVELVESLEKLAAQYVDRGLCRWKRLEPGLQPVFDHMGICAYRIESPFDSLNSGDPEARTAWLEFDLPGKQSIRVRLALTGSLASLAHPEQVMLLEKVLGLINGEELSTRQYEETGETAESTASGLEQAANSTVSAPVVPTMASNRQSASLPVT